MSRLALILTLSVHVALTASEAPGTELGTCFEQCPDDDAEGNCAATCTDCTACPHAQTFTISSAEKHWSPGHGQRMPRRDCLTPPTPEPAEILHVPIAVRA